MTDSNRSAERLRSLARTVLCLMLALAPTTALAALGDCGQPATNGDGPTASDALFTLRAAVGSKSCDLCVCDVSDDAHITASDALKILKKAVGQAVALTCPSCQPSMTGVVTVPPAAASSLVAPVSAAAALNGLVPASGVTVELLSLDAEGTPQLAVLATTISGADGSYHFTPAPAASSQTIVRATIGDAELRAFVSGETVDIDPMSELIVGSAIAAVVADADAGLGELTVAEIENLVELMREANIDLGDATSVADAVSILDDQTGGVYAEFAADFATGSGPTTAVAGNFNVVQVGAELARSFQPGSIGVSSVNTRSIAVRDVFSALTVAADGAISQPSIVGRAHMLSETSGSTPQQSGPAVVTNASATVTNSEVNESVPPGTSTLLASDHGALLFQSDGAVSPGVLVQGSNFALIPVFFSSSDSQARGSLAFALRQGQGLSNASLSATYPALRFTTNVDATTDASNVHREVRGAMMTGTLVFDGNGHLTFGAIDGTSIQLSKDGPTPAQAAADPTVVLSSADDSKGAESGPTYTLSSTGVLTVKVGNTVVAVGAVTPDRNIVVLHFSDDSAGSGRSGFIIGFKPGSAMNTASGHGKYRTVEFDLQLQHTEQPGSPDVSPDMNVRSVGVEAGVGSFDMDGAGVVSVYGSCRRSIGLNEASGVQRHNVGPSDVIDADVSIFDSSQTEQQQNETHTYSVSSKGVVTVDVADSGGMTGYLSADGNVFMLPNGDINNDYMNSGLLIAVREP